jgi:hypothetical protein
MKKLLIPAIALCFLSCSKSDDGHDVTVEDLVGKWNYETYHSTVNGTEEVPEEAYAGNAASCSKDFVQLNEDGTLVFGDYLSDGDCTLSTGNGTWWFDEEGLTMNFGFEPYTYEVNSVSGATLNITKVTVDDNLTYREMFRFSDGELEHCSGGVFLWNYQK